MKKALKILSLSLAVAMLLSTLCGCSALINSFIDGFNEGYNSVADDDGDEVLVFGDNDDDDDDYGYDEGSTEDTDVFAATSTLYVNPVELYENRKETAESIDIIGKWVDEDGEYVAFYSNGTVDWFGEETYRYSFDGNFLTVSDTKFLSRLYGDTFVIYNDPFYYSHTDGETGSLYGRWESSDDNDYSFEFYAEDNYFIEDDEWAGRYYIQGNDIILCYEDTYVSYCIFVVNDDQLGVAYGLPFMPAE